MQKEQNKDNKRLSKEYKILAKNSILSIIHSYSLFFFSLITSFIIARLITPDIWSYLILSSSYITIFSLILTFLPPSLNQTFNYYIPKYRALKQFNELRSFVQNSIILRSLFVLLVFIISLVIFISLSDLFKINLENYYHILLILSPMLIINGLSKQLIAIERAFNMFNLAIYLLIIRYILNIGGLIFNIIFFETIQLSTIAYINLISNLIPFLINCLIIILLFKYKIGRSGERRISFKKTFKYLYSYGSHLSVKSFIDGLVRESRIQLIRFFESPDFITGYHIAFNYKSVSGQIFQAMSDPLTISFSELYAKQKYKEMEKVIGTLFVFLIFVILIMSGILIYFADFFIFAVYGESFLRFSLLFKLTIFSIIFNVIGIFFQSILRATNKVKYVIPISLLNTSITFFPYIIGLIFFGIHEAVLGIFFGGLINFFILIYFIFKLFKIKVNLKKVLLQYSIFFISLGIALLLEILILKDINTIVLDTLYLSYFKNFQFLSIAVFLIMFLLLNIIFKIFSITDIEMVEEFFSKQTRVNKIIRKGTKLLKKFIKEN